MKGRTLEIILFAGGFLLMVAFVYAYITSETTSSNQAAAEIHELKVTVSGLSKSIAELIKSQQALLEEMIKIQANVPPPKTDLPIAVKVVEPVRIDITYHEPKQRPLIPTDNHHPKSLLDRAGIKPHHENK